MGPYKIGRRQLLKLIGGATVAASLPIRSAHSARNTPLSLGYPANLTGVVAIIAEQEKIFDKVGAQVSFHKFNSGVAVRDAMVSGRVELGLMNATPFVIGVAKGELSGLAVGVYAGRVIMVVAGKNSNIKTISDLKGRKVGSQIGSGTDHVFQNKVLPKFGLKVSDLQIVNVKFAEHISALASGSVDAYAGTEPYSSVAEHEGIGRIIIDYGQFDLSPIILAVNRPVIDKKREAVVTMLKGWLETVKFIQEQPARASHTIWKYYLAQGYSAPESVFRSVLDRLNVTPDYVPELNGYLTEQAQILLDKKQINHMPNWDKELLREPLTMARKLI